jgi:hypothetical protein
MAKKNLTLLEQVEKDELAKKSPFNTEGVKSFVKDVATKRGAEFNDNMYNELVQRYRYDYDQLINDVGKSYNIPEDNIENFRNDIYNRYGFSKPSEADVVEMEWVKTPVYSDPTGGFGKYKQLQEELNITNAFIENIKAGQPVEAPVEPEAELSEEEKLLQSQLETQQADVTKVDIPGEALKPTDPRILDLQRKADEINKALREQSDFNVKELGFASEEHEATDKEYKKYDALLDEAIKTKNENVAMSYAPYGLSQQTFRAEDEARVKDLRDLKEIYKDMGKLMGAPKGEGWEKQAKALFYGFGNNFFTKDFATLGLNEMSRLFNVKSAFEAYNKALQEVKEKPKDLDGFYKWWETNPDILAWREEFVKTYGEEPKINNADYDYYGAYEAGVTPKPSDVDGEYHWGSIGLGGIDLKSVHHPTRWKSDYMKLTGVNPDKENITKEQAFKKFPQLKQEKLTFEEQAINTLPPEEQELLYAYQMLLEIQAGADPNTLYNWGEGLKDMIPFIIQFAATGGVGAGAKQAVSAFVKQKTKSGVAGKIAGSLVKSGLQAGAMVPANLQGYAERVAPTLDDEGNLVEGMNPLKATVITYANTVAEVVGEDVGTYLNKSANKVARARYEKMIGSEYNKAQEFLGKMALALTRDTNIPSLQGVVFEGLGEEVTGILQAVINQDDSFFTSDVQKQIWGMSLIASGTYAAASTPNRLVVRNKYNQSKQLLDDIPNGEYAETIENLSRNYDDIEGLTEAWGEINKQFGDSITPEDKIKARVFIERSVVFNQMNTARAIQVEKQMAQVVGQDGNVTLTQYEGQPYTVRNPQDLGKEGQVIMLKDPEGNVKPVISSKIDDWSSKSTEEIVNEKLAAEDQQDVEFEQEQQAQEETLNAATEKGLVEGKTVETPQGKRTLVSVNPDGTSTVVNDKGEESQVNTDEIEAYKTQEQKEAEKVEEEANLALMEGIEEGAEVVSDEPLVEGSDVRIIDFSNGQSKIITPEGETIVNSVEERDAVISELGEAEIEAQQETIDELPPEQRFAQLRQKNENVANQMLAEDIEGIRAQAEELRAQETANKQERFNNLAQAEELEAEAQRLDAILADPTLLEVAEEVAPEEVVEEKPIEEVVEEPVVEPEKPAEVFRAAPETGVTITDTAKEDLATKTRVEPVLNELQEKFGIPIQVLHSSEMPEHVKQAAKGKQITASGFYDPSTKTAYILSDKVKRIAELKKTFMHEAVLHKGLDVIFDAGPVTLLGKTYETKADLLDDAFSRMDEQTIADRMKDYAKGLTVDQLTDTQKRELAEEALATLSETESPRLQVLIDKLYNFIKKMFGFTSKQFSKADLRNLLREHRNLLKQQRDAEIIRKDERQVPETRDVRETSREEGQEDIQQQEEAGARAREQEQQIKFRTEEGQTFDEWKGDNEYVYGTEISDVKTGTPIVAKGYHGTTHEFYEFKGGETGNIEGHLGRINYFTSEYYDARMNYGEEGADLTGRIEQRKDQIEWEVGNALEDGTNYSNVSNEWGIPISEIEGLNKSEIAQKIAEKELKGGEEQVLELYLKLNNPLVLGEGPVYIESIDETELTDYMEDAAEEIKEENVLDSVEEAKEDYSWDVRNRAIENSGAENKVIEALRLALEGNENYNEPSQYLPEELLYEESIDLNALDKELRKNLDEAFLENDEGELISSQVMADFYEELGYDGVILTDVHERFANMGLHEGVSHIHIPDQYNNQIKLADGSNVTFGETPDIRFRVADSQQELEDFVKDSKVKETVYHGTGEMFDEFDPDKTMDGMFWFTSNIDDIKSGMAGAARSDIIIPVKLNLKNPAGWEQYDKLMIQQIIDQGYDGLKLDDYYVAFSPDQILIEPKEDVKFKIEDYQGMHSAPVYDGSNNSLNDLSDVYPDDIYGSKASQYYSTGEGYDYESINVIQTSKGKPNARIKVYRAVPDFNKSIKKERDEILHALNYRTRYNFYPMNNKTVDKYEKLVPKHIKDYDKFQETIAELMNNRLDEVNEQLKAGKLKIEDGNWVTTSRHYAIDHGRSSLNNQYKILQKTVRADELFTEGNSIHEWGYQSKKAQDEVRFRVEEEREKVETSPSEAQIEAGNYQKGHIKFDGFDISIENPKGSIRRGTNEKGEEWSNIMPSDYGYFKGTIGKDKDHIDVFLGDNLESDKVYVVDQVNPETGSFDEHKILMGYNSISEARNAYMEGYEEGWQGLGAITRTTKDGLKEWFKGDTKKPFAPEMEIKFKVEDTYKSIISKINKDKLTSYLKDNNLSEYEIESTLKGEDTYWIDEYLNDEYQITITNDGLIQFEELTDEVKDIVGNNDVLMYHHTSTGVMDDVSKQGLKETGVDVNRKGEVEKGVYLTTQYSGPEVDGYKQNAVQVHGGNPITLEVKTKVNKLIPDVDDADIKSGIHQFTVDNVSPKNIINIPTEEVRFQVKSEDPKVQAMLDRLKAVQELSKTAARVKGMEEEKLQALGPERKFIQDKIDLYKEAAAEGKEETKELIKEVQKTITDYAKKALPLTEAGAREIGPVMTLIKNAQSPEDIEAAINRIDELAGISTEKQERRKHVSKVNRLLKWMTGLKKSGTKKVGKFNYEDTKAFQELKDIDKQVTGLTKTINSTKATAEDKAKAEVSLDNLWNEINEKENKTSLDEAMMKLIDLRRLGAKASSKLAQIVSEELEAIYLQAKEAKSEADIEAALNRKEDKEFIKDFLRSDKSLDSLPWIRKAVKRMNTFVADIMGNWETLMTTIGGQKLRDKTSLMLHEAQMAVGRQETMDKVLNKAKDIYGGKSRTDTLNKIHELSKEEYSLRPPNTKGEAGEGDPMKLSKLDLMDIYNAVKNEDIAEDYYLSYGDITLKEDGSRDIEAQRESGKERIDALIDNLSDQDKEVADAMQEELDKYYDQMNAIHIKLYNRDLPRVENYWPSTAEREVDIDVMDQFVADLRYPGSTKERAQRRTPIPTDAFNKFTKHVDEAEWFINMAMPIHNVNKLFKDVNIKRLIENKRGDVFYKNITQAIQNVGLMPPGKQQQSSKLTSWLNPLLNNWVASKIGATPSVPLKQLLSAVNYAENMPAGQWAGGFVKTMMNPPKSWSEMMKIPYLKTRLGDGYSEAVQRALNGDEHVHKSRATNIHSAFKNLMTIGTRYGDIAAIIFGGKPYLDYLIKKEGLSEQEAVDKFLQDTLRSQQAPFNSTLSKLQNSKNPFFRAIFAFSNTPSQYMRKLFEANQNLRVQQQQYKDGKITKEELNEAKKKAVKAHTIYGLVNTVTFTVAGSLINAMMKGSDPDDEIWKDIVNQLGQTYTGGLPVIKDIIGGATRKTLGMPVYESSKPFIEGLDEVVDAGIKLSTGKAKNPEKEYEKIAQGVATMLGVPYYNLKKDIKAIPPLREETVIDTRIKEVDEKLNKLKDSSNNFEARMATDIKKSYTKAKSKATRLRNEGKVIQADRIEQMIEDSKISIREGDYSKLGVELRLFNKRLDALD